MKKLILTLLLGLLVLSGNSQIKLVIVDGVTKVPLPYTTIQSINKKEGFITDENGFIQLNLSQRDTIHISYVGYKSINYVIGNITNYKIELFKETGSTLPDVIVKKYTPIEKPIKVGLFKYKVGFKHQVGSSKNQKYPGHEISTLVEFPNENEKFKLLKVILPTNKIEKDDPLRLHIYSLSDNGEPLEELLINDIILDKGFNLFGNIEVDVSNQNIILNSKGVFVGIQWVGVWKEGNNNTTGVYFTEDYEKYVTYNTNIRLINKKWEQQWKKVVTKEGKFLPNLRVGLELQKMK
jgi:hypothetical protein